MIILELPCLKGFEDWYTPWLDSRQSMYALRIMTTAPTATITSMSIAYVGPSA